MTIVKIKKQKKQKSVPLKENLNLQKYKTCLEATQLYNKINHLEKNETDVGSQY